MHAASKLGSFMALRANGWSLSKISKDLNISKSTLWEWDNKNQNEIHLLKHLQLEKLQEKYLPTYEEELSKLRSYLDRLETALQSQDFSKMGPEYLLQMALQLRARLGKMREQVPLRTVRLNEPAEPLPYTGCVSRQDADNFRDEFFAGEPEEEGPVVFSAPEPEPGSVADKPQTAANGPAPTEAPPSNSHKPEPQTDNSELDPVKPPTRESINPPDTNRTFPDENTPRLKHRPLYHNDFRYRDPEPCPVLHSQNGNANGHLNGNGHVNGNGHPGLNGHHTSEDRRDQ